VAQCEVCGNDYDKAMEAACAREEGVVALTDRA
jgi:hypothetical protein